MQEKAKRNPSRVTNAKASKSVYSVILPKNLLKLAASWGVKSEIV
jgi:hypothetical protein